MSKQKTLIDIFRHIKAGDTVLFQKQTGRNTFEKPELVIIVAIDVWDMACAVYYTRFKDFGKIDGMVDIKVHSFGEWMEFWNVLGHWRSVPKFKNLLKAYRKKRENVVL